jgi:hypothetical protein
VLISDIIWQESKKAIFYSQFDHINNKRLDIEKQRKAVDVTSSVLGNSFAFEQQSGLSQMSNSNVITHVSTICLLPSNTTCVKSNIASSNPQKKILQKQLINNGIKNQYQPLAIQMTKTTTAISKQPTTQKFLMSTINLQPQRHFSRTIANTDMSQQRLPLQQRMPITIANNQQLIQLQQNQTSIQTNSNVTMSSVVTQKQNKKHELLNAKGRGRISSNRPPGAVNYHRSYQICQAVIQNSPNRHQLKAQLKPPTAFIQAVANGSNSQNHTITTLKKDDKTQYGIVTSSSKVSINYILFATL